MVRAYPPLHDPIGREPRRRDFERETEFGLRASLLILHPKSELPSQDVLVKFPVEVSVFLVREDTSGIGPSLGSGVIAPHPQQLPMKPERHFFEVLGLLYSIQRRMGTVCIGPEHRENDQPIGRWVRDLKRQHHNAIEYPGKIDDLPQEWKEWLECLNGLDVELTKCGIARKNLLPHSTPRIRSVLLYQSPPSKFSPLQRRLEPLQHRHPRRAALRRHRRRCHWRREPGAQAVRRQDATRVV